MNKILLVILIVGAVISASYCACAVEDTSSDRVILYYFHGSFRCHTCTNMEKYSEEAIESYFSDEVSSGKLVFKDINVEEKGNSHYVDDYGLYTKSLVLSLVKDGTEVKNKNLDRIWHLARDKQKFIEYVASEVRVFIKGSE